MTGKLFDEITVAAHRIKSGEFNRYSGTVRAAAWLARTLLKKPDSEIVQVINRLSGKKLKKRDFLGRVTVEFKNKTENRSEYRLTFGLVQKKGGQESGSVELILIDRTGDIQIEYRPDKK